MKEGKWLGALAGAAALAACSPEKMPDTSQNPTESSQSTTEEKNTSEHSQIEGAQQGQISEDQKKYNVILSKIQGGETNIVLPHNSDSDVTSVNLSGTEKQRVSPVNSDPTTVVLEGTKPVRVDPINPHSKPVEVILKGTKPVRVNPVNPYSKPTRVNL